MFQDTILNIAHDVCKDLKLQRPATLFPAFDDGDTTAHDMERAATKVARFLLSYHHWEHLQSQGEWTALGTEAQTGFVLPVDFHRLVPHSVWDDTARSFLYETSRDQWHRRVDRSLSRNGVVFNRQGVELLGQNFANHVIKFTYMRKWLCRSTAVAAVPAIAPTTTEPCGVPAVAALPGGVLKERFTHDLDVPLWDAELFSLGMIWSIQHRDGNTTNEDYQAFVGRLNEIINHDAPSHILNMVPAHERLDDDVWGDDNVHPSGPWGNPSGVGPIGKGGNWKLTP